MCCYLRLFFFGCKQGVFEEMVPSSEQKNAGRRALHLFACPV